MFQKCSFILLGLKQMHLEKSEKIEQLSKIMKLFDDFDEKCEKCFALNNLCS